MLPYVVPGPPFPIGLPLPLPAVNVLGFKVNQNDTSSFVNIGPSSVLGTNCTVKTVAFNNGLSGDWGYTPVWWGVIYEPSGLGDATWSPQGYL